MLVEERTGGGNQIGCLLLQSCSARSKVDGLAETIAETHGEVGIGIVLVVVVHLADTVAKKLLIGFFAMERARQSIKWHQKIKNCAEHGIITKLRDIRHLLKLIGTSQQAGSIEMVHETLVVSLPQRIDVLNDRVNLVALIWHMAHIVLQHGQEHFLVCGNIDVAIGLSNALLKVAHRTEDVLDDKGKDIAAPIEGFHPKVVGVEHVALLLVDRLERIEHTDIACMGNRVGLHPCGQLALLLLFLVNHLEIVKRRILSQGELPIVGA